MLSLLAVVPAFLSSQALELSSYNSTENSQSLALLSPNFSVIVPDAIGGPTYTNDGNSVLVANTGTITGEAQHKHIEDTHGTSLYIVRKGDTLSEIADLFDVSVNTIKWENNLGKTLKVGQELRILPVTGVSHTIKKGETFGKIAVMYNVEIEDITIFNDLDATKLKIGQDIIVPNGIKKSTSSSSRSSSSKTVTRTSSSAQSGYYTQPTYGRVSSRFGPRSRGYHYGIDIANSIGTPIVAAASGTVVRTTCGTGYGICTIVQHNNGTKTLYAHTNKLFVKTGDTVKQGQKIAELGNTGRSTGPHLHFEIIDVRTGAKKNPNNLY